MRAPLAALVLGTLAACTGEPVTPDAGLPPEASTPILSEAVTPRWSCAVEAPVTLAQTPWLRGHGIAARGSKWVLARIETDVGQADGMGTLVVSVVSASGEAERHELRTATIFAAFEVLSLTADEAGWALVYRLGADVMFARSVGEGIEDAPLGIGIFENAELRVLPRAGGGWRLLWTGQADRGSPAELRLADLDATGAVTLTRTLHTADPTSYGLRLAATAGAVLWAELGAEGTHLEVATLDAAGTLGVPRPLRDAVLAIGSFADPRPALLASGGGFVAAWPERSTTLGVRPDAAGPTELRQSTIWVARLDADGALVGAPRPLTAAEPSVDQTEPELVALGEDVALVWSRGSVIYECAGCQPDHDLRLVALSPTLTPLSAPLALGGPAPGGLLGHQTAGVGGALGIATRIQHHITFDPALAFVRCE